MNCKPQPAGLATTQDCTSSDASKDTTTVEDQPLSKPWYNNLNPLHWGGTSPIPSERIVSREYSASFIGRLTFQWITPLMITGFKRQLHERDIWKVNPDRAADRLADMMKQNFAKRVANGTKKPLMAALHKTFKTQFWLGGFCALMYSVLQVLSPFALRYLIQFASDVYTTGRDNSSHHPPVSRGVVLAIGITMMQVIQSICFNHFIYFGMVLGCESRTVLVGMIYEKAMVISGRAMAGGDEDATEESEPSEADERMGSEKIKTNTNEKRKGTGKHDKAKEQHVGWDNGRIVNLMSVDASRIDQACALLHMAWTTPLSCCVTFALLLVQLTYSALAGCALFALGVFILARAAQRLFRKRRVSNKITDERISLTQEVIQSMRFIKYLGWEKILLDRLAKLRAGEISAVQKLLAVRNILNAGGATLPVFASMLSFMIYEATGNGLAPAKVFSSLALFMALATPLTLMGPVFGQVVDALSSLDRIEGFLLAEEAKKDFRLEMDGQNAIEIRNATFTWEKTHKSPERDGRRGPASNTGKTDKVDGTVSTAAVEHGPTGTSSSPKKASATADEQEPFQLENLNFQAGRNELIAVIGTVGSGKTSLLAALAGEMRKTGGDVVFGASRAFCPQSAWIQEATLRENIIFGKDFDPKLYRKVINACALQQDLDMLPSGDETETGERGITLSGGQKQRVNIARAIYFNADIVLMDDPLSAVDAHVGRHIFEQAILGLLGDKCRILATHQLWVLERCDRIIWMDAGSIRAVGTFQDLMQDHQAIRTLLERVDKKETKDQKEEDEIAQDQHSAAKHAPEDSERQEGKEKMKATKLIREEERAEGAVPWSVYGAYIRASGSIMNGPLTIFILILYQGSSITTNLWLSFWTSDQFGYPTEVYIGIYVALGVTQAVCVFAFSHLLSFLGTTASKSMLLDAMNKTLRAPMSFFDSTPVGRITNRFSSDVDYLDNFLPDSMRMFLAAMGAILGICILISVYFYYFLVALAPLSLFYIVASCYYLASARQVKRYEAVSRSSMVAKFSEGITGVACIRAYELQDHFIRKLYASIDNWNGAYHLTCANQRWISLRLDAIANMLVLTVGILAATSRFDVNPSTTGLVLSYILSLVQSLQFSIRRLAEVENGMNSVERLRYFATEIEEEAPLHTILVRKSWPEKGEIIFNKVDMQYRSDLPLILRELTMHIKGGERLGIVGRTGAGKSSIMTALFRLVEISGGSITIDGVNISTIGLFDLRSRLTIIPQDPTLLNGTIRSNLDPLEEHTDQELCSAMQQAGLAEGGTASEKDPEINGAGRLHLNSIVKERGMNLSLGQRQLMALARALVCESQIVICDEATSSVDMDTDEKVQRTIVTAFRGKTLLYIAHRLHSIIGYDRICVMDAGQIAQLDTPANLFAQKDSIFRGMCERSGLGLADIQAASESMRLLG